MMLRRWSVKRIINKIEVDYDVIVLVYSGTPTSGDG